MSSSPTEDEAHSVRGAVDRGALFDFSRAFTRLEPLATGELDDFLNPSGLGISLDDGLGSATSARLDVVWTTQDDYNIHYSDDEGLNARWDRHPNDYPNVTGDKHFHPPPDASSDPDRVQASCIEVTEIELVARATHKLWRRAYEEGSTERLNQAENPP